MKRTALERGVDGFTGKPIQSRLQKLPMPSVVFRMMSLNVIQEFPEPFSTLAGRVYHEVTKG